MKAVIKEPTGKELEFTYDLGDNMKIDIEKAREKRQQKEEQSKREFEELKKKLHEEKPVSQRTPLTQGERSVKFSGGPKQISILREEEDEEV